MAFFLWRHKKTQNMYKSHYYVVSLILKSTVYINRVDFQKGQTKYQNWTKSLVFASHINDSSIYSYCLPNLKLLKPFPLNAFTKTSQNCYLPGFTRPERRYPCDNPIINIPYNCWNRPIRPFKYERYSDNIFTCDP